MTSAVLILLLAIAMDLGLGDPPTALHPTGWMGQMIRFGARRAPQRGMLAQFVYGAFLILLSVALVAPTVYFALSFVRAWNDIAFVVVNAVILKTTFSLRSLNRAAHDVYAALVTRDLTEARQVVAWHLVSRETGALDEPHVVSATVESVAENLADSFVAPLFFFVLLGVPGALACRLVNTADAMIGYHGATEYLGKFAARLDDLFNLIPSRVSGLLIVAGAMFAGANAYGAWRVLWRDHTRTTSPNAGWAMSAMAGALDIRLEKIGHYSLGDAAVDLEPALIPRASKIINVGAALWIAAVTCAIVLTAGY